jgi:hypothetical protein
MLARKITYSLCAGLRRYGALFRRRSGEKRCAYRSGSGLARRRRLLVFFAMIGSPYGLGRMRKMSL